MASGSAIRGSRIGSSRGGEPDRGAPAPRTWVSFWCENAHETTRSFAQDDDVDIPELWDCPRCGLPAGTDPDNPPQAPKVAPFKTHLAYVKERRTDADGEALLDEALEALRMRRGR